MPYFERKCFFDFGCKSGEVERHETLNSIVFTHSVYQLPDAFAVSSQMIIRIVRGKKVRDSQFVIRRGDQGRIRILIESQICATTHDVIPKRSGIHFGRYD